MGWIGDEWDERRNDVNKYLWVMLMAVLREVGEAAITELAAGLQEYLKESKTPDGWTKEEYLSYAIGRLTVLRSREIGPSFVDRLVDMAIDRLIDHLEGKLEEDTEEES